MVGMDAPVRIREAARTWAATGLDRGEIFLALAAFAALCAAVLRYAPYLVEPDDFAYRASIVAMAQGHFLTLSPAQYHALSVQLARSGRMGLSFPPGIIPQWVQLADGRWISEKDPGFPFLAAPFQALGIIRLAPDLARHHAISRRHLGSAVYEQFFRTVRAASWALPPGRQIRVLGDPPIDWSKITNFSQLRVFRVRGRTAQELPAPGMGDRWQMPERGTRPSLACIRGGGQGQARLRS